MDELCGGGSIASSPNNHDPVWLRRRSVPDIAAGRHGDAAFADYTLIAVFSHRF